MRISDWSSDVCSSDLPQRAVAAADNEQIDALCGKFAQDIEQFGRRGRRRVRQFGRDPQVVAASIPLAARIVDQACAHQAASQDVRAPRCLASSPCTLTTPWMTKQRSEKLRVGKACVMPFRYRGSPYHKK